MAGALAGASLLFTSAILSQPAALDRPLRVALCCFAGVLPVAVLGLVLAYTKLASSWFSIPFWLSGLGTCGGVLAVLWHLDARAAIVFLVALGLSGLYFFGFLMFTP